MNYWFAERKSVSRPKLRVCWTEIVKKSFNDQQWVKKLKNEERKVLCICNRLILSFVTKGIHVINTPVKVDHRVVW